MTLTGYFALNFIFAPVWLARTVRLSKNDCVKSNKDRHILQRRKSLAWTLVPGNIKLVRIFAGVL